MGKYERRKGPTPIFNYLRCFIDVFFVAQSPFNFILDLDENIASNWDLYLITVLTLLLGLMIYLRRPAGPVYEAAAPAPAAAAATPPAEAVPTVPIVPVAPAADQQQQQQEAQPSANNNPVTLSSTTEETPLLADNDEPPQQ